MVGNLSGLLYFLNIHEGRYSRIQGNFPGDQFLSIVAPQAYGTSQVAVQKLASHVTRTHPR